jgi:hypothetical protein
VINDARLAGLIDWEAIVDRTRNLQKNSHWTSPKEIVEGAASQYQIDKWATQEYRVEVWVEKDALIGILENICRRLDVSFFSCRGYTSQSEMHEAAQRLLRWKNVHDQKPVIIHLGDHDPSGKDMTRDIQERMDLFAGESDVVTVERIALNMDQIKLYRPPPNPAKITDSRARNYIKEFGQKSWELDALDPKVIEKLIRSTVNQYLDQEKYDEQVEIENKHKATLLASAKKMKA